MSTYEIVINTFNNRINSETVFTIYNAYFGKYKWYKFSSSIEPWKQFKMSHPDEYNLELLNFSNKMISYFAS